MLSTHNYPHRLPHLLQVLVDRDHGLGTQLPGAENLEGRHQRYTSRRAVQGLPKVKKR